MTPRHLLGYTYGTRSHLCECISANSKTCCIRHYLPRLPGTHVRPTHIYRIPPPVLQAIYDSWSGPDDPLSTLFRPSIHAACLRQKGQTP